MPYFSIIVPVYNAEQYLSECVDSILSQSFSDFELILVDDGSPDSCPKLCDDYSKCDSRIKVVHKHNGGVSSARNIGIQMSKGEYIWFVDADDRIYPDSLQAIYDKVSLNRPDILSFDVALENKDGSSFIRNLYEQEKQIDDSDVLSIAFFFNSNFKKINSNVEVWGNVFKTETVKKSGVLFDEKMFRGEDVIFTLSMYAVSKTKCSIGNTCYYYRYNQSSCMNSFVYSTRSINNSIEFIFNVKRILSERNIPDSAYGAIWNKQLVRIPIEPFIRRKNERLGFDCVSGIMDAYLKRVSSEDFISTNKSRLQRYEERIVTKNKQLLLKVHFACLLLYGSITNEK